MMSISWGVVLVSTWILVLALKRPRNDNSEKKHRRTSAERFPSPGAAVVPGPHVEPHPRQRITFRSFAEDPTRRVGSGISDPRYTRDPFVSPMPDFPRVSNLPSHQAVSDRANQGNQHEREHGIVRFVGLDDLRVVDFV